MNVGQTQRIRSQTYFQPSWPTFSTKRQEEEHQPTT